MATYCNNGLDYRSLSWYGEQACRTYFCLATNKLPAVYQQILIQTIDDWYVFGLIVTEHALVTAYFKEVEFRLGRHIAVSDYTQKGATDAFREFAGLKTKWPYRRDDSPGPWNFFFENGPPRQAVFCKTLDIPPSSYEKILRELESGFSSAKEIAAAEQLLDDLFLKTTLSVQFLQLVSASFSGHRSSAVAPVRRTAFQCS